ncbi:MAG: hypothetical protein ACM3SY_06230 [Candidatus Omnitrophota bacterium]
MTGACLERNEIYVNSLIKKDNNTIVKIIDPQSGIEKREIAFPLGDEQSPVLFNDPSYIQYLDGKYFVYDHINKILVYNGEFKYLYTDMCYSKRIFIDFYSYDNQLYFLLGRSITLENTLISMLIVEFTYGLIWIKNFLTELLKLPDLNQYRKLQKRIKCQWQKQKNFTNQQ